MITEKDLKKFIINLNENVADYLNFEFMENIKNESEFKEGWKEQKERGFDSKQYRKDYIEDYLENNYQDYQFITMEQFNELDDETKQEIERVAQYY